jgi:hypothetical protein
MENVKVDNSLSQVNGKVVVTLLFSSSPSPDAFHCQVSSSTK